jgi:NAD+ kinase
MKKIAFIYDTTEKAQQTYSAISSGIAHTSVSEADILVVLGGDGFMLETLHRYYHLRKPFFGINCGTIGFLMNTHRPDTNLMERVTEAKPVTLHPLRMVAYTLTGITEALAINEVSLLRQSRQAAKIAIYIDGIIRMEQLICDGILLSTPAGSTAYNLSAYGPIIPLSSKMLALTPISAFRPRRWRGALLHDNVQVTLQVMEPEKRPVSAVADDTEARHITKVDVRMDSSISLQLLFDGEHTLEERIFQEQFF